ncbi:MAG: hypothetical protein NPMRTH1_180003 [Nitrosopumilales archaeon]|nr:MAG: hypothetical protein NPMRTH1_180003 [Nitrosopumilales archaeon]
MLLVGAFTDSLSGAFLLAMSTLGDSFLDVLDSDFFSLINKYTTRIYLSSIIR